MSEISLTEGKLYKKPSFWIVLITVIICIVVLIYFFTNPKETEEIWDPVAMEEDISEHGESIEEPVPTFRRREGYVLSECKSLFAEGDFAGVNNWRRDKI